MLNPYLPQYPQNNAFYGSFGGRCEIIRVNGENGARAYQLPPNSSALLLDETNPIVWLAQTDGAGYKTVKAYDIMEHEEPKPFDASSLEARIQRLEEMILNGKSDPSAADGQQS